VLTPNRVYMLAADHRWQWEEWCDARSIPRARITEVKELARCGFVLARDRSERVREHGALLIDEQYGSACVARALEGGVEVGTPAEKAGAFPLEWAGDQFADALTGAFVKVLVRHRTDHPPVVRQQQLGKLLQLQEWCRASSKPLVVEVLVPRDGEAEAAFDATGRPAMLASFIREAYGRGLTPAFWKIEGTSRAGAAVVDRASAEWPAGRQLILGKGADQATVAAWFAAARASATAAGFAVGRTVYWEPAADYLLGEIDDAAAVESICETYLALIQAWEKGSN
jgi:5-dehydro-2-deoxygluconokinase